MEDAAKRWYKGKDAELIEALLDKHRGEGSKNPLNGLTFKEILAIAKTEAK